MQSGRKRLTADEKLKRGTLRPSREVETGGFIDQNGLPSKPDWLTAAGECVWIDEIGRVSANRLADERDSTAFANFCNLQGAIGLAWRAGDVPPAAHLIEARKMAEQFGLFGARSRQGVATDKPPENPFSRLGLQNKPRPE